MDAILGYVTSALARSPFHTSTASLPSGMSNARFETLSKAQDHKKELQSDISKAFENPGIKTQEETKSRVREKIQQIVKRLNILKKLFSGDPKQMAKALTQVFKELKAALKEYKDAMKAEMGLSAGVSAGVVPPEAAMPPSLAIAPSAPEEKDAAETQDATGEEDAAVSDADAETIAAAEAVSAPDAPETGQTAETVAARAGTVGYGEVESGVRKVLGEDGLQFVKELRALVKDIEEKILSKARIQMKAKKPDKDMDKAFEEVEKELKDLQEDMKDMENDIHRDVPEAGMRLNMVA